MEKLIKEIFMLYNRDVYLYLYSLTHDSHLSEDLTAEVFLELLKSAGSFRRDSDVKTFLFSIARHRWCNYLRKNKRKAEAELLSEFIESGENLENHMLYKELEAKISDILKREKERDRNVAILRLNGFSFHEIAIKLSISESSARVIFFRVKNRIKENLEKEGYYGQ